MKIIELSQGIARLENLLAASKLYSKFIKPVLALTKDLKEQQAAFESAHNLFVEKIEKAYGKKIPSTTWDAIREELAEEDKILVDELMALKTSDVVVTSKVSVTESYLDKLMESGKCDGVDIARTVEFFDIIAEDTPPKEADKD